jgi:hypothetical protein
MTTVRVKPLCLPITTATAWPPKELLLLNVCTSMPLQLPTEFQARQALNVFEQLREHVFASF